MNGIKIPYTTGKTSVNKYKGTVKKYDQSFKKTRAGKVDFNVSSYVSVKQLKQAYGKSLRKLPSANNGTKMYAYSPNNKHYGIAFTTKTIKSHILLLEH